MAQISKVIERYSVALASNGVAAGNVRYCASILCHGGEYRYALIFLLEGSPNPGERFSSDDKIAYSYLPSERYPWYVDLLRNEGPLVMLLETDPRAYGHRIVSGTEPVGEGE